MSVGFQIFKSSKGWRLATDNFVDLTNWDLDYRAGSVLCRPKGVEFLYMAIGTVIFLLLAAFLVVVAVNPRSLAEAPGHTGGPGPDAFPAAGGRQLAQSKFEQAPAAPEEIQQSTERLKQRIMQDMTPEERARFEQRLQQGQSDRNRQSRQANARIERIATIVSWIGRVFAVLGAMLFGFIGGVLCLPRALRFFRDQITIDTDQHELILTRPKVLGGLQRKSIPIDHLAAIVTRAVLRPRRGRYTSPYVAWMVDISSRNPDTPSLRFELEHLGAAASRENAPYRVRQFAAALQSITRLPMATGTQ